MTTTFYMIKHMYAFWGFLFQQTFKKVDFPREINLSFLTFKAEDSLASPSSSPEGALLTIPLYGPKTVSAGTTLPDTSPPSGAWMKDGTTGTSGGIGEALEEDGSDEGVLDTLCGDHGEDSLLSFSLCRDDVCILSALDSAKAIS